MPATMTITGIDERTKLFDIVRLTEQYPWLEIGMLYTVTPEGRNRYPGWGWLAEAACALSGRCALHVCGRGARARLFDGSLVAVTARSERIQINGIVTVNELCKLCDIHRCRKVITQHNRHNVDLLWVKAGNHQILVDASRGQGITPSERTRPSLAPPLLHVGFAGGLGPDNLATELPKIAAVARGDFWVDMENNLRSDDWFDIEKAKRACEAFAEWRDA